MYDTKNDTNLRRLEADQTTYHTASVDGTEINFEKLCVRRSTQTNFISFSIHMICESCLLREQTRILHVNKLAEQK